jgi:hypothetical protein
LYAAIVCCLFWIEIRVEKVEKVEKVETEAV